MNEVGLCPNKHFLKIWSWGALLKSKHSSFKNEPQRLNCMIDTLKVLKYCNFILYDSIV